MDKIFGSSVFKFLLLWASFFDWWLLVSFPYNKYDHAQNFIFPESSAGKESTCNARDPGSIPGSERSAWEGIGYPLQYSWACLVAQLVKNPPAMWKTWVWSLSWEDPLEKGKATHGDFHGLYIPWGHKESDRTEWLSLLHAHNSSE